MLLVNYNLSNYHPCDTTNIYNSHPSCKVMPIDAQQLVKSKDFIVSTLRNRGPTLPIEIARVINQNTIFASAFLSELYNEQKVKMSHMKVGSSSLYYLEGQQHQLERFIQHLNHKEREAYELLRNEKLLQDDTLEPAIRVALREIKDFAIPVKLEKDGQQKLFWKHFLAAENEVSQLISPPKQAIVQETQKEDVLVKEVEKISKETENLLVKHQQESPSVQSEPDEGPTELELPEKAKKDKKSKKKPSTDSKFTRNMREYLSAKDIEILQVTEESKALFSAKVRIDTMFGKQEYLLVAKDKKKLKEEDIIHALHKAQNDKMPALLMSPGEIDKKHLEIAKDWRNLVKFEKIKF